MVENEKVFLSWLYGCEDSDVGQDGRYFAEARYEGCAIAKRFHLPSKRGVRALGARLSAKDYRSLENELSTSFSPGDISCMCFNPLTLIHAFRGLYCAKEVICADVSGVPDEIIVKDIYYDNPGGIVTAHLCTNCHFEFKINIDKPKSAPELFYELADKALNPPERDEELLDRKTEQEKFLQSLNAKKRLRERLAVARANRLHALGYYYNTRRRPRLSRYMSRREMDSLNRAAKRYLKRRRLNEQ